MIVCVTQWRFLGTCHGASAHPPIKMYTIDVILLRDNKKNSRPKTIKFFSFHCLIQKSARFETRSPVSRSQSDRHYVFCSQFLEETRKTRGEGKDQSFALNGRQVLSWRTPLRMRTGSLLLSISLSISFFL